MKNERLKIASTDNLKIKWLGSSLVLQWLGLGAFTAMAWVQDHGEERISYLIRHYQLSCVLKTGSYSREFRAFLFKVPHFSASAELAL